jgi:DNA-binding transcriptional ArsR family regulator
MSSLISRIQRPVGTGDEERSPRFVDLGDGESDEVLDALGSTTSRRVYRRLLDDPATPSTLAEAVDTSVQNAAHHVSNLESAGLIEPVGTRYSEKGREMTVWAATDSCVVLAADRDDAADSLTDALGNVGALALLAVAVQVVGDRLLDSLSGPQTPLVPASPAPPDPGGPTAVLVALLSAVEPGVAVLVAGAVVLAVRRLRRR